MLDINSSALKELIEKTISKGDSYAEKNILAYESQLGVHIYGDKPTEILEQYRPGETAEIKKYRLAAYKPKPKAEFDKALNVLYSIFNPKLFHISYPEAPKFLGEEDTLKNYINEDFPCGFGSLLQYVKTVLLKKMLASPNGCVVILPVKNNTAPNEFVSPFPYFYETKEILAYVPDNYILVAKTKDTYWLVDDTNIIEVTKQTQDFSKDRYTIQIVYTHNLGYLPAFQIGGLQDMKGNSKIFRSYIDGAIPHWDDAVRLESDLQACYVQHMYPERVEVEKPCNTCDGKGYVFLEDETKHTCNNCGGAGNLNARTPYGKTVYKPSERFDDPNNSNLFPGVMYVQKDITVVKMLEEKVERETAKGLEAINMDIVKRVGANQSGIAKEYDRKELNAFLQQVSDRIWEIYELLVYYVSSYRYKTLLGSQTDTYLPNISKPSKFDMLLNEDLLAKIQLAKEAGADNVYMKKLELQSARLEFGEDSLDYKEIETIKVLNPFGDRTIDELMVANAILPYDKTELFVSLNIARLVNEAYLADEAFFEKTLLERKIEIYKLANEKIASQPKTPTIPVAPLI